MYSDKLCSALLGGNSTLDSVKMLTVYTRAMLNSDGQVGVFLNGTDYTKNKLGVLHKSRALAV